MFKSSLIYSVVYLVVYLIKQSTGNISEEANKHLNKLEQELNDSFDA